MVSISRQTRKSRIVEQLRENGITDITPDKIWVNYDREARFKWSAIGLKGKESVYVYGWDTITDCAQYGISVGIEPQGGNLLAMVYAYTQEGDAWCR